METDSPHGPATESDLLAPEAACYARAAAAIEAAAWLASRPPIDLDQIMANLGAARQDLLAADDLANLREPGRAHLAGTVLAMRRVGVHERTLAGRGMQLSGNGHLAALLRDDAARILAATPAR